MSTFDLCCPGPSTKAPGAPGKSFNEDPRANLSDEDSYGPTPPPPPAEPHPDDYDSMQAPEKHPDGDKFNDEYSDVSGVRDMEKGSDPPQETTHEISDGEDDDDDEEEGDFEEDQSVEIPPTKIVKRMIKNDEKGGSRTLLVAGCVACCLLIAALVLAIGFGTGAFTSDSSDRSAPEIPEIPPTDGDGDDTIGVPPTEPAPVGPEPAVDPAQFAGLPPAEFIPAISLADPSVFEDFNSVESLALDYVLTSGIEFDTNVPEDRTRLIQMYALRTLWWSSDNFWVDQTGWEESTDECTWFGVFCDENSVVTEIDMIGNGLTGTIPADFPRLDSLTILSLSENDIEGPLPPYLFTMSNLEELYIDSNNIEDTITYVTGLTNIRVFYASGNNLSGDIGVFWYATNLERLILNDNNFTGTLDGISALQNLCK